VVLFSQQTLVRVEATPLGGANHWAVIDVQETTMP
jgi:hypothetical protein